MLYSEAEAGGVDSGDRDVGKEGQARRGDVMAGAVDPCEGSDIIRGFCCCY